MNACGVARSVMAAAKSPKACPKRHLIQTEDCPELGRIEVNRKVHRYTDYKLSDSFESIMYLLIPDNRATVVWHPQPFWFVILYTKTSRSGPCFLIFKHRLEHF